MAPTVPDGAVVVGVDGTGKAERALVWAGNEAARRGAPVHILYAFPWITSARAYELMPAGDVVEAGEKITGVARKVVLDAHPDLAVTTEVLLEEPAVALVDASESASVVVMGARGLGPIASRLLGSVSQKVAAHAHGPVVIVREGAQKLDGPVVAGVDPEQDFPEVLEFAFSQAAARGVGVRLVHAWAREPIQPEFADPRVQEVFDREAERVRQLVVALGDEWATRHPGVPVEVHTASGRPAEVLAAEAPTASLLVVGARGRRGLAGVRLGSVARGVLHEAPVVAVVRPRGRGRG
ncbi:universal stress protein [Georgenia thermotolerans]|uniref:Universal stress protein n=1 Tax=Georgenia thermotolerans TaxID=527326 RepID=A0A7J5UPW9_9MICO|nr:universal stress protein [Georgenia thermotolerans]KAE8764455.1 universal stress protein [Georgenia thermotolerans]